MDIRRQVGLNVQRFRRALDLSQEELAFEAEIHRTYISGVERGVRNITVTVVARLAGALKVQPHQLLEPLPTAARSASLKATRSEAGAISRKAAPTKATRSPPGPHKRGRP
jgi:transcriptional regulator with XRE-family HTH domain